MRYIIIIEKMENNYSAYSPDLTGCGITAPTLEQAKIDIIKAIDMHIKGIIEDGESPPVSHTYVEIYEPQLISA